MGWDDVAFSTLPEDRGRGVEAVELGSGFRVRFELGSDGRRIERIDPSSDWSMSLRSESDTVALQLRGLVEADSWTVLFTRRDGGWLTLQIPADELAEDWVYLEAPGLDDKERFAGVILIRDVEGPVVSALSFRSER